jgi:hypothetical protein
MNKRQMIACVSDQLGKTLVEKKQLGGWNNIAELLAISRTGSTSAETRFNSPFFSNVRTKSFKSR